MRYRFNKFHSSDREGWKSLAIKNLKKRWQERCIKYNDYVNQEAEYEEREKRKQLHHAAFKEARAVEHASHLKKVESIEEEYHSITQDNQETGPLLLDAVITPVIEKKITCGCSGESTVLVAQCKEEVEAARRERNRALAVARQYRDMAEASITKRRQMKSELEERMEVVRNFWHNNVIEGGSRSGRILRAALIKK